MTDSKTPVSSSVIDLEVSQESINSFEKLSQHINKVTNEIFKAFGALENVEEKVKVIGAKGVTTVNLKGIETFTNTTNGYFSQLKLLKAQLQEVNNLMGIAKGLNTSSGEKTLLASFNNQSALTQLSAINQLVRSQEALKKISGFNTNTPLLTDAEIKSAKDLTALKDLLITQESKLQALKLQGKNASSQEKVLENLRAEIQYRKELAKFGNEETVNIMAQSRYVNLARNVRKAMRDQAMLSAGLTPTNPQDLKGLEVSDLKQLISAKELAKAHAIRLGNTPEDVAKFDAEIKLLNKEISLLVTSTLRAKTEAIQQKRREATLSGTDLNAISREELSLLRSQKMRVLAANQVGSPAYVEAQSFIDAIAKERENRRLALKPTPAPKVLTPYQQVQSYREEVLFNPDLMFNLQKSKIDQQAKRMMVDEDLKNFSGELQALTDQKLRQLRALKLNASRLADNVGEEATRLSKEIDQINKVLEERRLALKPTPAPKILTPYQQIQKYREQVLFNPDGMFNIQRGRVDNQAQRLVAEQELMSFSGNLADLTDQKLRQLKALKTNAIKAVSSIGDEATRLSNELANIDRELEQRRIAAKPIVAPKPPTGPRLLSGEELGIQRQNIHNRMWGDGGANMLMNQGMVLMHYAALNSMTSVFSGAITSAVELDKVLRNLQAISASTNTEMVGLRDNLLDVAKETRFSAVEIADAAVVLAQAGLKAQDIKSSMKAIATLAQASGSDLNQAVDVTTSVLSVFNLSADKAEEIANKLTASLNMSKLTMEKLVYGIQYAGNAAAQSGVSFDELVSSLAALSNAGIKTGSSLGTGLQQIFLELSNPTKKLQDVLNRLGLSVYDVNINAHGLEGVLKNLHDSGFKASDAFEAFDVRAGRAFVALSNSLETFDSVRKELDGTTAGADASKIQMESFANKVEKLKTGLAILGTEALEPTLTMLKELVTWLTQLIEAGTSTTWVFKALGVALSALAVARITSMIVNLGKGFYDLIRPIQRANTELIANAEAANVASAANARAAISLKGIWGGALAVTGGVAGLVAALGTLGLILLTNTDKQDKFTKSLEESRTNLSASADAVDKISQKMTNINESIDMLVTRQNSLTTGSPELIATVKELQGQFTELGSSITDVATTSVTDLIRALQSLRQEMSGAYVLSINTRADDLEDVYRKLLDKTRNDMSKRQEYYQGRFGGETFAKNFATEEAKKNPLTREERSTILDLMSFLKGERSGYEQNPQYQDQLRTLDALRLKYRGNPNQLRVINEIATGITEMDAYRKQISNTRDKISGIRPSAQNEILSIGTYNKSINDVNDFQQRWRKTLAVLQSQESSKTDYVLNGGVVIPAGASNHKAYLNSALTQAEAIKAMYVAKINSFTPLSTDDAGTKAGKAKLQTELAQGLSEVSKVVSELSVKQAKQDLKEVQQQLKAVEASLSKETADLPKAKNAEAVKTIKLGMQTDTNQLYDLKAKQLKLQAKVNPVDKDTLESQLSANQDGLLADMAKIEAAANDRLSTLVNAVSDFKTKMKDEAEKSKDKNSVGDFKDTLSELDSGLKAITKIYESDLSAAKGNLSVLTVQQSRGLATANDVKAKTLEVNALELKAAKDNLSLKNSYLNNLIKVKSDLERAIAEQEAQNKTYLANRKRLFSSADASKDADVLAKAKEFDKKLEEGKANLGQLNDVLNTLVDKIGATETDLSSASQTYQEKLAATKTRPMGWKAQLGQVYDTFKANNNPIDQESTWVKSIQVGLDSASNSLGQFLTKVETSAGDTRAAFRQMGAGILQEMLNVVNSKIAAKFLELAFSFLSPAGTTAATAGRAAMSPTLDSLTNISGARLAYSGTYIRGYNSGGIVNPDAPHIGRDNVLSLLAPKEAVLNRSATSYLGEDFVNGLNRNAKVTMSSIKPTVLMPPSGRGATTNVWVVKPEAAPAMGKDDVLLTLHEDILNGGESRKLIRAVAEGHL